ncbi:protealysin inhibitor emfourin, partial [Streptomyces sp. NPDC059597]|uniref:protealysin inhibitor emfourin n=1 Tax=Streptomyces sp. NPDC059597 TaxID=3346879 RepID=UPI0036C398F7
VHPRRPPGGWGGWAGRPSLSPAPRPDAAELRSLAERALASGHAAPPTGVPDGFHYEITVDGRTIHAADPRLSDAQRELVSRVLKEGA